MRPLNDLFEKLRQSNNLDNCFCQYMNYVQQFGLTNGLLISLAYDKSINKIDYSYINTHDANFFQEYLDNGGASNDISAQEIISSQQEQLNFNIIQESDAHTSHLLNRSITKAEQQMEELSRDYGVVEGFAAIVDQRYALVGRGIGVSAVGMSAREYKKAVIPHQQKIRQANYLFSLSLKRFSPDLPVANTSLPLLTPRQLDILRWISDGFRLQEIADNKVYRSIHTLKKELKVLKQRLNVETHEELVATGMVMGLID